MRVLVTGASGMLGGRLAQILSSEFEISAGHHQSPPPAGLPRLTMDLEAPGSVRSAIEAARPDAVLHAAAYAFADLCERDPEKAARINVAGSQALAQACAKRGIRLVAISTDLVFPGDHAWSDETRPPAPVMTYGRTKLQGEEAVLAIGALAVVARVPLIAGRGFGSRSTATEGVAWALRAGRTLTLFTDEYRTPTDADSIAPALAALLKGKQTGRYHLGGAERVSRFDIGMRVARAFDLPTDGIKAATQASVPMPAPRPADVSLSSEKARQELGYTPRSLDEIIASGRPAPE